MKRQISIIKIYHEKSEKSNSQAEKKPKIFVNIYVK
jgi:hypothetical protein